jgi:CHASE3 domain sensor protein
MIKTLNDCTVSHPVENIISWSIACIAVTVAIGLVIMVLQFMKNEW